ncbi:MAG TPA: peptidoglycan editing factor PgeF [Moraxellaceae bacterium]|nr:peptidoglycan editing factor PgeF [Moraxellaceae bacterium]
MTDNLPLLLPDWPAPDNVHAAITTRAGGVSNAPWNSLNLGTHVGDDPLDVAENRHRLLRALQSVAPCDTPQWLNQVHGVVVIQAEPDTNVRTSLMPEADAVTTVAAGLPCVVMTADCLPVFFCDREGKRVAVAHAGWRGLCDGILEKTLQQFPEPAQVMAWLGPAIGPEKFEVGDEVRRAFVAQDAEADKAFVPSSQAGRWLADIYLLARQRLLKSGLMAIYGGGLCTVSDPARFFSYRRDGQTGRMASVIWRTA